MKLKIDFVTNSSSSSFVVIGATIKKDEINEDIISEFMKEEGLTRDEFEDDFREFPWTYLKDSDLDHSFGSYGMWDDTDDFMVGMEYTQMKDDETLRQFKDRVKAEIKRKFNLDKEVGHIEECWEDR